ncbi:MAG: type III-B CRISPR module RAMP protein Cmr4 [Saprospiraceae bacterium]
MFKTTRPLFLICETPLHAGSGDDLGMVDLPIQRERHTNFPKVEASSLKGSLREAVETVLGWKPKQPENALVKALFGPEDAGNDAHSGCLALTDARTLLFPVKSMRGVFAWITCPAVLNRFAKDLIIAQNTTLSQALTGWDTKKIETGDCYADENQLGINGNIILEEYAFKVKGNVAGLSNGLAGAIYGDVAELGYWKELMQTNLVVLSDDDFRDFVVQSTEVITRIKIDNETGTVQDGALFTEEYLPSESVLYALASTADDFTKRKAEEKLTSEKAMSEFGGLLTKLKNIFQLGGNATLGKGVLQAKLL